MAWAAPNFRCLRLENPGYRLPGAVMSDLGLLRYLGYAELPEAQALKRVVEAEQAPHLRDGVHLIVVQSDDGSLVVGDSHDYADPASPFSYEAVDQLILDEYRHVLGETPAVRERWIGTYTIAPDRQFIIDTPAENVRLVVVTCGAGASSSFALAEKTLTELGIDTHVPQPLKPSFFDWAGTMIDFGCMAPVRALQAAFADLKLELTEAEARADMGMAKRAHITAILGRQPMRDRFFAAWGRPSDASDIDALFNAVEPKMIRSRRRLRRAHRWRRRPGQVVARLGRADWFGHWLQPLDDGRHPQGSRGQGLQPRGRGQRRRKRREGRPSPLMSWKALVELGAWPSRACVKVDDAEVGITEGREAGMWTIGLAASGNGVGLTRADFDALSNDERRERIARSADGLKAAGADYVVDSVADIAALLPEIEARITAGEHPGSH